MTIVAFLSVSEPYVDGIRLAGIGDDLAASSVLPVPLTLICPVLTSGPPFSPLVVAGSAYPCW